MAETLDEREEELRRRMLNLARLREESHQGGYVPSKLFREVRDDAGEPCASDEQAERLLNDLVSYGVLEESRSAASGLTDAAKQAFRHRRFRITTKGYALWIGDIPPIRGIADPRLRDQ
ncbi:MAG: hypothetical protein ACTHLZ_18720 [Tepidisphaeraceae bacterium]